MKLILIITQQLKELEELKCKLQYLWTDQKLISDCMTPEVSKRFKNDLFELIDSSQCSIKESLLTILKTGVCQKSNQIAPNPDSVVNFSGFNSNTSSSGQYLSEKNQIKSQWEPVNDNIQIICDAIISMVMDEEKVLSDRLGKEMPISLREKTIHQTTVDIEHHYFSSTSPISDYIDVHEWFSDAKEHGHRSIDTDEEIETNPEVLSLDDDDCSRSQLVSEVRSLKYMELKETTNIREYNSVKSTNHSKGHTVSLTIEPKIESMVLTFKQILANGSLPTEMNYERVAREFEEHGRNQTNSLNKYESIATLQINSGTGNIEGKKLCLKTPIEYSENNEEVVETFIKNSVWFIEGVEVEKDNKIQNYKVNIGSCIADREPDVDDIEESRENENTMIVNTSEGFDSLYGCDNKEIMVGKDIKGIENCRKDKNLGIENNIEIIEVEENYKIENYKFDEDNGKVCGENKYVETEKNIGVMDEDRNVKIQNYKINISSCMSIKELETYNVEDSKDNENTNVVQTIEMENNRVNDGKILEVREYKSVKVDVPVDENINVMGIKKDDKIQNYEVNENHVDVCKKDVNVNVECDVSFRCGNKSAAGEIPVEETIKNCTQISELKFNVFNLTSLLSDMSILDNTESNDNIGYINSKRSDIANNTIEILNNKFQGDCEIIENNFHEECGSIINIDAIDVVNGVVRTFNSHFKERFSKNVTIDELQVTEKKEINVRNCSTYKTEKYLMFQVDNKAFDIEKHDLNICTSISNGIPITITQKHVQESKEAILLTNCSNKEQEVREDIESMSYMDFNLASSNVDISYSGEIDEDSLGGNIFGEITLHIETERKCFDIPDGIQVKDSNICEKDGMTQGKTFDYFFDNRDLGNLNVVKNEHFTQPLDREAAESKATKKMVNVNESFLDDFDDAKVSEYENNEIQCEYIEGDVLEKTSIRANEHILDNDENNITQSLPCNYNQEDGLEMMSTTDKDILNEHIMNDDLLMGNVVINENIDHTKTKSKKDDTLEINIGGNMDDNSPLDDIPDLCYEDQLMIFNSNDELCRNCSTIKDGVEITNESGNFVRSILRRSDSMTPYIDAVELHDESQQDIDDSTIYDDGNSFSELPLDQVHDRRSLVFGDYRHRRKKDGNKLLEPSLSYDVVDLNCWKLILFSFLFGLFIIAMLRNITSLDYCNANYIHIWRTVNPFSVKTYAPV